MIKNFKNLCGDSKVLQKMKDLVLTSHKILLITHKRPDGDALGSTLGLLLGLEKIGKEAKAACIDPVPYLYEFLPGSNRLEKDFKVQDFDLIFILDCASSKMIGFKETEVFSNKKRIINIDHHYANDCFGDLNWVDGVAASTSEMIYLFLLYLGIEIDKDIATCLQCGIFTDTSSFQNQNTTERSLEISSKLLAKGAKINQIAKYAFYTKNLSTLRLWGKAMSSIFTNKDYDLVATVITQEDLRETKASYDDIEGIANFLNTIPDAKAVLVLVEKDDGTLKGSLRTRDDDVDVSRLAAYLGGGGHIKAAGFALKGKLIKKGDGFWEIE